MTAEEKIGEALTMLTRLSEIAKCASAIRKGALKIEGSCATIHDDIERLLTEARAALAGLAQESTAAPHTFQDGTSAA